MRASTDISLGFWANGSVTTEHMRKSGEWMVLVDDRILEFIRENGGGTPGEIAKSDYIRVSSQHVGRRCRKLADKGLLYHVGNSAYTITERGEKYLDGEIDTEEGVADVPPDATEENGPTASGDAENGPSIDG